MDLYIRSRIPRGKLLRAQHAYIKGRSVDTALHDVVSWLEIALKHKEFAVGTFLDIEGAFNNVRPEAVVKALEKFEVESNLKHLIFSLLCDRTVAAEWGGAKATRKVNRGTPQGGVLSPLLWIMVVNDLLIELETQGCRVTAYADDVVLMVKGKFLNTVYELTEGYLNVVSRWANRSGLAVNPSKTELVLFTRRYKIPNVPLPSFGGSLLQPAEKVKYLGLILDRKLSWRPNIEERVKKASVALYCCKGAIGKRWGLSPKVVFWLYETVVKPIMFYGVFVWWRALERSTLAKKLERVQRAALIGISGALRTTPTLALNAILNIAPVDIAGRCIAAKCALRLREAGLLKRSEQGHSEILSSFSGIPENIDHCVTVATRGGSFSAHIPTRDMWVGRSRWRRGAVSFFTDGSRLGGKVGGGVFCKELSVSLSFRLPDHCSVFQAEVAAIKAAVEVLLRSAASFVEVSIHSDSRAAILALSARTVQSKLVKECLSSLEVASGYFNIRLVWVPGHSGIAGNCKADELARGGTFAPLTSEWDRVGSPLASCALTLDQWTSRALSRRWSTTRSCATARSFWPRVDRRRSGELLALSKVHLAAMVGVLTGHCPMGTHAVRLGVLPDASCQSCMEEGEVESSQHFLLQCPAFARLRLKYLGNHTFGGPEYLSVMDIGRLNKFVVSTRRLVDL